jgi:hypothetical protein
MCAGGCKGACACPKGERGLKGPKGDKGDKGDRGLPGVPGMAGPAGISGVTGPRGLIGLVGPTGATGPTGPQGVPGIPGAPGADGIDGTDGAPGAPATITFTENCETSITQVAGSPDYEFNVKINDTGWVDLLGFNHYTGTMLNNKPKVRRIGSVLHFKGVVFIPLSSDTGATLVPLSASNAYDQKAFSKVYTGFGGVSVNTAGAIYFNGNTSCIPPSVMCSSTFDGATSKDVIALRQILLGGTVDGSGNISGSIEGVALSAFFRAGINASGVLFISTLKDIEQSSLGGLTYTGGSPLRFITSAVTAGGYSPKYNGSNALQDSNTAGIVGLNADFDGPSGSGNIYHFSCDAGEPDQIGGFQYTLDGLTLFLTH